MSESTMQLENGNKVWRLPNGLAHREDGPAIEWPDGHKEWYLNGLLHRVGGPAIEGKNGAKYWLQENNLHRFDGPAVESPDGTKEWWLKGIKVDPLVFFIKVQEMLQHE